MRPRTLAGSLARSTTAEPPKARTRYAVVAGAAAVVIAAGFVLWWTFVYDSPAGRGRRGADSAIDAGRGCFLTRNWAHVDEKTGLAVARLANTIVCIDGGPLVEHSPACPVRPEEFLDAWNAETRSRLAAGEPIGPRFEDRITTLDAVRERFRIGRASVVHARYGEVVPIGDKELRWYQMALLVRDVGAERWTQPVGGAPVEPDDGAATVTLLPSQDGRTVFAQFEAKDGSAVRFAVVDLATGTHLYVFPVDPR